MTRFSRPAVSSLVLLALATSARAASAAPQPEPAVAIAPAPGAAAIAAPEPTGRQIFQRYVEAIGGIEKLKQTNNVVMTGDLSLPAQNMKGTVVLYQARPNRVLVLTEIQGVGKMEEGFDGTTGWARDPLQGPRILEGAELEQLKHQDADLLNYAEADALYETMDLKGRTTFEGTNAYEVRLVSKTGEETTGYFDVVSGLQVGQKATVKSPMGELPVTTVFSDYRSWGGVKVPSKLTQRMSVAEVVTIISDVKFNVADLPSFAPPPDVTALIVK